MDRQRRKRVAVADRDYLVRPSGRKAPRVETVWARRPCQTASGRRLLAFRIQDERVEVLIAGSPPRWAPAESVLSVEAAKRWLTDGFSR